MNRTARIVTVAFVTVVGVAGLTIIPTAQDDQHDQDVPVAHVLLLSVDGLHASDLDWYVANHPDSQLAKLSASGRTYTQATATMPSDSFPGLLAMVTGGTPRSTGVYYDDGWDRALAPSTAQPDVPGMPPTCLRGAQVQWKQNLDTVPVIAPFITIIDPLKLPRDPADGCTTRVQPHQFPRVNNVFELVKAAGGRTAWSDKHPAYEFLNGPSGTGIDDLYAPEIASCDGILPCSSTKVTTNFFSKTMAYDDMKVAAIVNEITGLDHTGTNPVGVPTLFGMNFQAVSVGQKLTVEQVSSTEPPLVGGYVRNADPETSSRWPFTPSNGLLATLDHTDQSIDRIVSKLSAEGLLDSTLIIISAKHGNSPIDRSTLRPVASAVIKTIVNSVPPGLALLSADTGALIWLKEQSTTDAVVNALTDSMTNGGNPARIAGILSGAKLMALFPDPLTDSRTPDIVLLPIPGTVYTTSATKIADHGGFSEDDVHVALLVSQTSLPNKTINDPVETRQIACTILKALALACDELTSQQVEPSKFLPHSNHKNR